MTFNPKNKVHEFNTVTKCRASQAHKLYFIDLVVNTELLNKID
jgi:hypothetical protein